MKRNWPGAGLRARLTALVAATLVPVFAFAGVLVYQHAASERAGMKARVEETARILALVVDKEIERSQALLEGLAASPLLDRGDFEGFYRQAKHTAPDEERWIILFDRNRDQIINTLRPFGAALPKNVRAPAVDEVLRTGAPAVTDLLRGAVAGRPVVATGVPVLRGGEVRYVVSVTYGAEALSRLLVRHGLPQGWTISIVDRTGTIVARNRGAPKFVGAMAVPELAQAIRQSASGSLEAATLEGEASYASFARSAESGWTVVAGAPIDVVEAPVRRSMIILAGGGLATLLAALALAVLTARRIARPMATLVVQAAALAQGEAGSRPPTGLREVDQVGAAMSAAGDLLRRRAAEREAAEGTLRENEGRLTDLTENLPGIVYVRVQHPDGSISYPHVSGGLKRLLGGVPEAVDAKAEIDDHVLLIAPADREVLGAALERSAKTLHPYDIVFRGIAAGGGRHWLRSIAQPRLGEDGSIVWHGLTLDITPQKEAEEHQDFLMAELDHRVKNTLATVQSIVARTVGENEQSAALYGRIYALAEVHSILSGTEWRGADLRNLLTSLLKAHSADGSRISLTGPEVFLPPSMAQSLALTVHELTTNAAKYGALSAKTGGVSLSWDVRPEPNRLVLVWREAGGPPVSAPTRRGFGTQLIERGLAYEFGANVAVSFEPAGVVCSITLQLPEIGSSPTAGSSDGDRA